MAITTLQAVDIWHGGYAAECWCTSFTLEASVETRDATTFCGNGWRQFVPGLRTFTANFEGFNDWDSSAGFDERITGLAQLGTPVAHTVAPVGVTAAGDLAYVGRGSVTSWTPLSGAVGEIGAANYRLSPRGPLVRGEVLEPAVTARTATGNGAGVELGALSATQQLLVNLHVFAAGTGSATVTIESDADNSWASPTTRATFTAATGISSEQMTVAGAVADTWWRAVWTISGGAPSFLLGVAAGIRS